MLRWKHPKLGQVPLSDFIPIAESSGLIGDIGEFVFESASRDFGALVAKFGKMPLFVSINISSRELLWHDLIPKMGSILKKNDLLPEYLKIELTESLIMENPEYSLEVLQQIKKIGIGLLLDDFGTGYSSLSYLMRFPFDIIKIDRSFVQSRAFNKRDVVLRSIIAMVHELDQQIVAEGIEVESDMIELKKLGCEYAQGYYFSRPQPIAAINAMYDNKNTSF